MISRRTILTWLGLLPAMVAAAKVAPAIASISPAPAVRVRWKTVLEADGSSTWTDGSRRYLDAWVETQKKEDWPATKPANYFNPDGTRYVFPDGEERFTLGHSLDDVKGIIEDDAKALEARVAHWRDFKEFQRSPGITVDAEFYNQGERLRNDRALPPSWSDKPRPADIPIFQFSAKDW